MQRTTSTCGVLLAGLVCLWYAAHMTAQVGLNPDGAPHPCGNTNCVVHCTTGSVTGTLNKNNETICVGESVSAPTVNVTVNPGSKTRECSNLCSNWTEGPFPIHYTPTNWWEPPIPASFPNCGTTEFTAKAKGISQDGDCPADTPTVNAGTFTVKVVAVVSLTPDLAPDQGGLEQGSDPPTYWVCPCPGDVIVTAKSCPDLAADQLPDCWTFTGGTEIDKLRRKVSKESLLNGPVTFTVTAGTSTKTIILKTDEEMDIYLQKATSGTCIWTNWTDSNPETDKCGNTLAINCVGAVYNPPCIAPFQTCREGHYEYRYNGTLVGTCYYNGGENLFLYKTTKHRCRFLRTWHLTREPGSPTRWVVTKYDCLTGSGPTQNCRTAAAWNNAWGRPADELFGNPNYPANSCENQGTPCTPCPGPPCTP